MKYRRLRTNRCYFFTLVTYKRQPIFNDSKNIVILRNAFKTIRHKYPFQIDAIVILPDHIHCILTLPENDTDYSKRWRLIKTWFTKHCDIKYKIQPNLSRQARKQQTIWQHRYWEHAIRNDNDLSNHINYIHYNPVKHQLVKTVKDWPYSSFHLFVRKGLLDEKWGDNFIDITGVGKE